MRRLATRYSPHLRELAALRRPAQKCPSGPAGGAAARASPSPRIPRLRRPPGSGVAQWSGKTLADHRGDRRVWLIETLGHPGHRPGPVPLGARLPGDPDHVPPAQRMLHVVVATDPLAGCASPKPGAEQAPTGRRIFRQPGGRRDDRPPNGTDRLLTVEAAAERMSASVRFVRRLIAQRRIEFVKVGRHVRISESALAEFIDAGRVQPMTPADMWHKVRCSAESASGACRASGSTRPLLPVRVPRRVRPDQQGCPPPQRLPA